MWFPHMFPPWVLCESHITNFINIIFKQSFYLFIIFLNKVRIKSFIMCLKNFTKFKRFTTKIYYKILNKKDSLLNNYY